MFNTQAVHAGRGDLRQLGVHAPPIDLSTTAPLPGVEAGGDSYEALAAGQQLPEGASTVYQRLWNPTVARFEEAMAELESGEESVNRCRREKSASSRNTMNWGLSRAA